MSLLNYVNDTVSAIAVRVWFFVFIFTQAGLCLQRREKNDLRSVTLLEANAKVKDIAISRERITLRGELQ